MQTWLDTSAGNVANMNDVTTVGTAAYGAQTPVLVPVPGTPAPTGAAPGNGVAVSKVVLGTTLGVIAYQPTNPLANTKGEVVLPNGSIGTQMTNMISAQEGYQADTAMMQRAIQAYNSALTIGS
jgi:flagellar basal-body rod protein FlgC